MATQPGSFTIWSLRPTRHLLSIGSLILEGTIQSHMILVVTIFQSIMNLWCTKWRHLSICTLCLCSLCQELLGSHLYPDSPENKGPDYVHVHVHHKHLESFFKVKGFLNSIWLYFKFLLLISFRLSNRVHYASLANIRGSFQNILRNYNVLECVIFFANPEIRKI